MNRVDDVLRSFGMSGYLLVGDLKATEDKLGIELGHTPRGPVEAEADYYAQFELDVRREADEMSAHYRVFYCLETSIRKLIGETLRDAHGVDWWKSGCIPAPVAAAVQRNVDREVENGVTRRSDQPIDYTTFGELSVIISANWTLFGAIFTSQRAVEKVMSNLNLLRGPIAHCCPLAEDEVDRLRLAIKDWFRLIG